MHRFAHVHAHACHAFMRTNLQTNLFVILLLYVKVELEEETRAVLTLKKLSLSLAIQKVLQL